VVADPRTGLARDMVVDISVIPIARGNEVFQILRLRISECVDNALRILTLSFGKQTMEVTLGMSGGVLRTLCG